MIYLDPTEARDNTRLPQSIIDAGVELPGLEHLTGADFLISPLQEPCVKSLPDPLSLPLKLAITKHINSGLLVQRKSGRDLTGSITKLDSILQRMLEWTRRPWLLVIADLNCDRDGQCIVDDHPSGFSWSAVEGALCYWQLRGGMLTILKRDSLVAGWVNGWLQRLEKLSSNKFHQVNRVNQVLLSPDWKQTLETFPGIGPDTSKSLAESQGTLANCLMYLSDVHSIEYEKVAGVGLKRIESARHWMGLKENQVLVTNYTDELEEPTK